MKGVRRVEGAASQYDKDVFQGSMSIGFPRSPCTTDIPHSFAGGISQYRRVQLIVTHFIYWNGKNVAFPPFLFFSSSCDLFSLALPYTILLPPFSLHFSLVSPRISSLSTSSCSNFFFLSSSRFQSFLSSFFFPSIFIPHLLVSTTRVPVHPFFPLLLSFIPSYLPLEFLSLNAKEERLRNLSPRMERLRPKESNKRTPLQLHEPRLIAERESRPEGISLR